MLFVPMTEPSVLIVIVPPVWANPRRMMWDDYRARQYSVTAKIKVQSDQISTHLPEIVISLTRGLYESFDFFEPPAKMVKEELALMRGSKGLYT